MSFYLHTFAFCSLAVFEGKPNVAGAPKGLPCDFCSLLPAPWVFTAFCSCPWPIPETLKLGDDVSAGFCSDLAASASVPGLLVGILAFIPLCCELVAPNDEVPPPKGEAALSFFGRGDVVAGADWNRVGVDLESGCPIFEVEIGDFASFRCKGETVEGVFTLSDD